MRSLLLHRKFTLPLLRWPIFHCCIATALFSCRPGVYSLLVQSRFYHKKPYIHLSLIGRINNRSLTSNMALSSMKKKTTSDETESATAAATATSPAAENKRKRVSKATVAAADGGAEAKPTKRSPRKTKTSELTETIISEGIVAATSGKTVARKKTEASPPRKPAAKKAKQVAAEVAEEEDAGAESPSKAKKIAHQVLTERDVLPRLWDGVTAQANGSFTFKIASWNVAGLRALMKNHPDALANLVKEHDLDVLCLQETKLQEVHLDDPKLKIRGHLLEEEGYDAYYSCSTEQKGYSGTAVFIKRRTNGGKKQKTLDAFFGATKASSKAKGDMPSDSGKLLTPVSVSCEMGNSKHDTEGRLVVVDFPLFSLCNVYVPNSGQDLKRLQYRIGEWDSDFVAFMEQRQKDRGLPVMWLGDLNVAHTHLEVWNDGAKHLPKQAGVTPEERASFQKTLDSGWIDAFRKLHPTAKGHYSYWSQRAGNRGTNKGLRLDYFICHPTLFDESSKVVARDSYMVADHIGSDHCPVVLELEIKA